ncbi:MAG TPA: magnesium transporter CorA family protein [Actinomycetota bacterium]|nr:magnesium transporter CorA family protein [Actinomycetota bacterium]
MLRAECHSEATGWVEVHELERLSDLRAEAGNLLWAEVDATELDDDVADLIAGEFGLHPLAVEDALHGRQRPKLETYDTHLFVVVHELDEIDGQLEASQLAFFVGERWVLTVSHGAGRILEDAKARWRAGADFGKGPAALVHTLLDAVVDDYQSIADRLEQEVEDLEDAVLGNPVAPIQRRLYSVKQRVSRLRRYALPAQRLLQEITTRRSHAFSEESAAYFRDVEDHLVRITEQIRNVDDLASAVLELHSAEQARQLNDVTKKLTGWAAIIAAPTLIASIYGMNFELLPNEGQLFGFLFAVSLMIVVACGLFVYFKRKAWI